MVGIIISHGFGTVREDNETIEHHISRHEKTVEIEHTKNQLKMSKGQPLREQYFKNKLVKLEAKN